MPQIWPITLVVPSDPGNGGIFKASDRGPSGAGFKFNAAWADDAGFGVVALGDARDVSGPFTVEAWPEVNYSGAPLGPKGMFAKLVSGNPRIQLFQSVVGTGGNTFNVTFSAKIKYGGNLVSFNFGTYAGTGGGLTGTFFHVALTCDGATPTGTVKFYVNGVLDTSSSAGPGDASGPAYAGTGTMHVNSDGTLFGGGIGAHHVIDEVRLYNQELSGTLIAAHATNSSTAFDSDPTGSLKAWINFNDGVNPTEGGVPGIGESWDWTATLLRPVTGAFTNDTANGILLPSHFGDASVLHGNKLQWMQASIDTSGADGDRLFKLQVLDTSAKVLWEARAIVITASQVGWKFNFAKKAKRTGEGVNVLQSDIPLPDITVPPGGFVRLFDSARIDPAGDTVTLRGECRSAGALAGIGFGG